MVQAGLCFAGLLLLHATKASLLATSNLEVCVDSGTSELSCEQQFVTTMTVQNGQGPTESVSAYRLRTAKTDNGQDVDVLDTVTVTLQKSQIVVRYPLVYKRTFNAKPKEIVLTRSADGTPYNFLTNPCQDGTSPSAACGFATDYAGQNIPYSQGFCCRCSLTDYLAGQNTLSRSGLQCSLFDSSNAQSAHCLRFGPLWYSAFSMGTPIIEFTIDVIVDHCASDRNNSCGSTLIQLSPSVPSHCATLAKGGGRNVSTSCDLLVSLEGDLASYTGLKDFSNHLLFIPSGCDDHSQCGSRLDEPDRVMIIPTAATTSGAECNKIGVSYEAFYAQSQRCGVLISSCLGNQIDDLYQADADKEQAGLAGNYYAKYHADGGEVAVVGTIFNPVITFGTNVFQKSVVMFRLNADSVRYVVKVATASITAASIPPFEAMSANGKAVVTVQNVGNIVGDFVVSLNCTKGLISAVQAQPVTCEPQQSKTLTFALFTEISTAAQGSCIVSVKNGLGRVTDTKEVSFQVTRTIEDRGSQGGNLTTGAPTDSQATSSLAQSCSAFCAWVNVLCALSTACWPRIVEYAAVILSLTCCGAALCRCCVRARRQPLPMQPHSPPPLWVYPPAPVGRKPNEW
jgi:hypothetical protein